MDLTVDLCNCGSQRRAFSQEYDSYYCHPCNKWLESKCDDPTCEFCVGRPKTPIEKEIKNGKKANKKDKRQTHKSK